MPCPSTKEVVPRQVGQPTRRRQARSQTLQCHRIATSRQRNIRAEINLSEAAPPRLNRKLHGRKPLASVGRRDQCMGNQHIISRRIRITKGIHILEDNDYMTSPYSASPIHEGGAQINRRISEYNNPPRMFCRLGKEGETRIRGSE